MFQARYRLCDLFGIPIYVDMSFAFLLLIFAMTSGSLSFGLAIAVLLAVSVTAHELGHALTAAAFGFRTRDINLSLLGGCASLIALPRKAWQEFTVAVAGPAVSILIAAAGAFGISLAAVQGSFADALGYILSMALDSFGVDVSLGGMIFFSEEKAALVRTLSTLSIMNMMLGIFNLLPGFPMDGGRVFRSAMRAFVSRAKATYAAMMVGRCFAVLLGVRGLLSLFSGGSWGVVSILIAWMIWREGWREYQIALVEERWGGPWRQEDFNARVSPPPYGKD
jgi:stage IV sporulation protein FB